MVHSVVVVVVGGGGGGFVHATAVEPTVLRDFRR
jgi:hypothetical protein